MDRRTFLAMSITSGVATLAGCAAPLQKSSSSKQILVLGGTNFLGPAIVETARSRGHVVTLFNRGITRPEMFPDVEKLRGLRAVDGGDLTALRGNRRWDAVIDVWPSQSRLVEQTADLLSDRADYYFFVSSIAAYRDFSSPGLTEDSPVHENDPGWYGGEKVLAERAVQRRYPGAFGICRCHAILGARDSGHAYHYWLRRLSTRERVLAPGDGSDTVQITDVRDVANWIVNCAETNRSDIYNIVGPTPPITIRDLLEESRDAIESPAELTWVNADFLRGEMGVQSFTDMPLWAPHDEDAGFYRVDGSKALDAGVRYRPLGETARDAGRWYKSHFFGDLYFPISGLGLSSARETEILLAWDRHRQ